MANLFERIVKFARNPKTRIDMLSRHGFYNWMSDKAFISMKYKTILGRKLNISNPITFNEKLQWLKLNNRRPEYTSYVDKYLVKEYISRVIGAEYVIPTLVVWDDVKNVDYSSLPDRFVLKCTHDSGSIAICKDKSLFDAKGVTSDLSKCLKQNFYYLGREWPYKNVKPRIIAECYLEDQSTNELRDYKFFCFWGKVKCFKVDFDRFTCHKANYYDVNGNLLNIGEMACPPDPTKDIKLPKNLNKMIEFAERLSKEIPFVRIDFYEIEDKVLFGEMTFFPASGFGKFIDERNDYLLGEWLDIEKLRENV